jgi:hypothetical protein
MLKVDSFCLLDDSMKTLRFVAHWSASVRQGFVGAFVVGSLLWVMQPANAHGDVRGDAAMPDTISAMGPQMTFIDQRVAAAVRNGDPTSPRRDSALMTMSPRTWMP